MTTNHIRKFCIFASIGSIVIGFALIIKELSGRMSMNWGDAAEGFTPYAILIAGGLISLAICGLDKNDE